MEPKERPQLDKKIETVSVLDVSKHNPALAADMLKYSLLLLKPRMYIDIGLSHDSDNIKSAGKKSSIEFAKEITQQNNTQDHDSAFNIAIDLNGRLKNDMILAGTPGGATGGISLDLQILFSTSTQECKDILAETLKKCIEVGPKIIGRTKYGSPYSQRAVSWTGCAFDDVLISHQKKLYPKDKECDQNRKRQYGSLKFPIIPVTIAGLDFKDRNNSVIPDYKKEYAPELAIQKNQLKDALNALRIKAGIHQEFIMITLE